MAGDAGKAELRAAREGGREESLVGVRLGEDVEAAREAAARATCGVVDAVWMSWACWLRLAAGFTVD